MYRAVALAGALLLVACSSDSESPTVSAPSSQSVDASTTTSTTVATTATTAIPAGATSSPQEAATTLVSAWRNGDRDTALTVATPAAVDALFGAGDPGSVQNRGCNSPPAGPVLCVYRSGPGEVQIRVQPTPDGGAWYVDQARVTAA